MSCPLPLAPVCDAVGGAVGSAASGLAGGALGAIAAWIVQGASWLLTQIGKVISSTTSVDLAVSWFPPHFQAMATLSAAVAVPMLLLACIQALYHQSAAVLGRAVFVHLPLAGLLTGMAVQLVQLALAVTDGMCTYVTRGDHAEISSTLHEISVSLSGELGPLPTFVVTIGGLLIVGGALVLWLEMLVRAAAIYVAVLFLPLALASLLWPAVSHWCRRLVETLAALVLSKFVVVAVLSLAVGAVTSGNGFATVLAGGALLLLAAFTPFTLLRLVPMVESGAAMQLEGARQRARQSVGHAPRNAVAIAMRQAREHGAHAESFSTPGTPGVPGTGMTVAFDAPGGPGGGWGRGGDAPDGGGDAHGEGGRRGRGGGPGTSGSGSGRRAAGVIAGIGAEVIGGAHGGAFDGAGGGAGGGGDTHGAARLPGAVELSDDDTPGILPRGPLPIEWVAPGSRRIPPGTIPPWEGDPTSVLEMQERLKHQPPVVPDGYGGIIPGIPSPLWGGTEPLSRFEPGPKDDWGDWQPGGWHPGGWQPGDGHPGDGHPGDGHPGDGHPGGREPRGDDHRSG